MTRQEFIENCKKPKKRREKTGITMVVSLQEREEIREAAKKEGLTITNYVRSRLFFD